MEQHVITWGCVLNAADGYWKVKWNGQSLSCVLLLLTPWNVALQAPLSMGCSRQEHWSGLPFPPPGDLPNPGIFPMHVSLFAGRYFIVWATREAILFFFFSPHLKLRFAWVVLFQVLLGMGKGMHMRSYISFLFPSNIWYILPNCLSRESRGKNKNKKTKKKPLM